MNHELRCSTCGGLMPKATDTVVVVGNGPSLRETPLVDLSRFYTTIGVNRIHLIYPDTSWRPEHWVIADRSGATEWETDVPVHVGHGYTCWVREDMCVFRQWYTAPNLRVVRDCSHIDIDHEHADRWHLEDPEKPICKQGGSVHAAIQIAVKQLAAKRILIVGCDMGFQANKVNHFSPDYVNVDYYEPQRMNLVIRNLDHCWRIARDECEARGVELLNAGIGGELDTLSRVNVYDYLT